MVDRTEHDARGRLHLDVLLPAADNAGLEKIGGPGREYWVHGANFANDVDPAQRRRTTVETGDWRIELSPRRAAAEDLFLTVMQTTDRTAPARLPVTRLDTADRTGCVIAGPATTWIVLLRRDGVRSAAPVTVALPAGPECRVLVTDLSPGRWTAQRAGAAAAVTL
ncbi:heparinase II protein, partial [sediment metagenome]